MAAQERIYRATQTGLVALAERSDLSIPFGKILAFVEGDTHFEVLRAAMSAYREDQISGWLGQLETLGFLESIPAGPNFDLDFTGILSQASLAASRKAA